MVNIAFKRAKQFKELDGVMHPDFITEFADTSLFPQGFHRVEDGYEILGKDLFDIEYAKNEQLRLEFEETKLELKIYKAKLEEDKRLRDEAIERSKKRLKDGVKQPNRPDKDKKKDK